MRCQALEALVDMATVYAERFQDDPALTQFLLRLQIDGADPGLLRVGAESTAKLLFSSRLSEPKVRPARVQPTWKHASSARIQAHQPHPPTPPSSTIKRNRSSSPT